MSKDERYSVVRVSEDTGKRVVLAHYKRRSAAESRVKREIVMLCRKNAKRVRFEVVERW